MDGKKHLIFVLLSIQRRIFSIFFSRLILSFDQTSLDSHIRLYDKQCQAATYIVSILDTKIKAMNFKFFQLLKWYNPDRSRTSRIIVKQFDRKTYIHDELPKCPSSKDLKIYSQDVKQTTLQRVKSDKMFNLKQSNSKKLSSQIENLFVRVQNLSVKIDKKLKEDISKKQKQQRILKKMEKLQNDMQQLFKMQNKIPFNLDLQR